MIYGSNSASTAQSDTGAVEDLLDPITDPVDAYRQFGLVPPVHDH